MSEKRFDAYAYVGVIAPGTVLVFGGLVLFPDLNPAPSQQGFTVGDLGIFLLLAFVVGHLVQAVGNVVERVWWFFFGGMPTDWIMDNPQRLLAKAQVDKLGRKVAEDLGIEGGLSGIGKRDWFPITRQIYAKVSAAGQSDRADTFNRNYGLMRGVTASFFMLAVVVVAADYQDWKAALIVAVLGVVALARMHRCGKHYAREVFVQYLEL